jgi:broad specificity phosphatase PhoE
MVEPPPIVLVRHGETEWSATRRHTGRSDIPLNPAGIEDAEKVRSCLPIGPFGRVWSSPSSRARETARLAGFPDATVIADLAEWDYGAFEGLTTSEIQRSHPGWNLFRDGCPNGEDAAAVGRRADRVINHLRRESLATLIFSSGHFLRVLAVRWVGWPPETGAGLALDTASISILGTEHGGMDFVVRRWNTSIR